MPLVVVVPISASVQRVLRQSWCPYRHRLMSAESFSSSFQIGWTPGLRILAHRELSTHPVSLVRRLAPVMSLGDYVPGRLAAQIL